MKKLYDEVYKSGGQSSRNIWYSELTLTETSDYGALVYLSSTVQQVLLETIQKDLNILEKHDETNWYFYDSATSKDAIEDDVRTTLMVKKDDSNFVVHINFSDYNFATNLNEILKQKLSLEEKLEEIHLI